MTASKMWNEPPERPIDRAAQAAIDRHRRLLCHKVLELALGELVALDGIQGARRAILVYARELKHF